MSELKACPNPWCEFAPGMKSWFPENPRVWPFYVYAENEKGTLTERVECKCGIKGPHFSSEIEAIAAWNTRPEPQPPASEAFVKAATELARALEIRLKDALGGIEFLREKQIPDDLLEAMSNAYMIRKNIEASLQALASFRALPSPASAWQPIETAPRDGMTALEHFEFVAQAFYNDVRMLRPGKSQSPEMMGSPSDNERQAAWEEWSKRNERLIRCFVAAHDHIFGDEP